MFNCTSKHQARSAVDELEVVDRGGGAGRVAGHVVRLQLGAKWTEGSGFAENGLIVDGRLSKIGRELRWAS
ncbi:MAG: DUF2804 family protein [Microthrixaceae bacterium]